MYFLGLTPFVFVCYETIRILGHSMKGSGGGFGFDTITDIGIDLENAAMEKDSQGVIRLVNQLEDYMENVEIIYE